MRSTNFILICCLTASCGLNTPEEKPEESMLHRFPQSDVVLANTKGADDLSTAAMQWGVLSALQEAVSFIALKEGLPTSAYEGLQKEYQRAIEQAGTGVIADINATRDKTVWRKKQDAWVLARSAAKKQVDRSRDSLYAAYQVPLTQVEMEQFHTERAAANDPTNSLAYKFLQFQPANNKTTSTVVLVIVPLALGQLLCVLLIIGMIKGYRYAKGTVALAKEDPTLLMVDGVRNKLKCYTGRVIFAASSTTTHTRVRGDHNHVESSSYSVDHDKFHVVDVNGKEHAVHLWNSAVQIRPGSIVSAAWFEGPSVKHSGYILFMNHDTDKYAAYWSNLDQFFHSRSSRMATNGFWLAVFSAGLAFYTLFASLDSPHDLTVPFFYFILQTLVGVVCWIGALLAYSGLRSAQRNAFSARDVPRLAAYLKDREFAVGPLVEGN